MADLGIVFLRRKHTIHWYQSLFTIITGSMPFRYFWATLYNVTKWNRDWWWTVSLCAADSLITNKESLICTYLSSDRCAFCKVEDQLQSYEMKLFSFDVRWVLPQEDRQYAVKAQTSLAPLSWFPSSHKPTAHVHQCCRFQSYANSHA